MSGSRQQMSARVAKDLLDLDESLSTAAELVARGRAVYDSDRAIQLAFEALSNRIGEAIKRLARDGWTESQSEIEWAAATRHRDFLVHHYQLIDPELLWSTMAVDLPRMHAALQPSIREARAHFARSSDPAGSSKGGLADPC
jgi:uncharacterized protein with HEPN domain